MIRMNQPVSDQSQQTTQAPLHTDSERLAHIDNIRWLIIVLVLSMHSADTYSPFGNWYYTEHPKVGLPTLVFFGFYQSFLQAFFMALLFFIAGYFTPGSYDKKGAPRFLYDRFVRLGIPTLLYMLAIGPLTEYYVSKTWRTPDPFVKAWWDHITDGQVFSMTGPMWFCAALLVFCLGYAVIRSAATRTPLQLPSTLNVNGFGAFILITFIAVTTFMAKVADPSGEAVYNMHLTDFPSYLVMFAAGICAYRTKLLASIDPRFGRRWGLIGVVVGFVLWPVLVLAGGALQGNLSAYTGGWHWQSFGMSVWAATICVGVSLGLLVMIRERFNNQGPLARFMSANAFAVYLFHPPILIGLALVMQGVELPAIAKFLSLTVLSVIATFVSAELIFRRIPVLRRIL